MSFGTDLDSHGILGMPTVSHMHCLLEPFISLQLSYWWLHLPPWHGMLLLVVQQQKCFKSTRQTFGTPKTLGIQVGFKGHSAIIPVTLHCISSRQWCTWILLPDKWTVVFEYILNGTSTKHQTPRAKGVCCDCCWITSVPTWLASIHPSPTTI